MDTLPYGISKALIGDDDEAATVVKFGDGLNRIFSVNWGSGTSGILVARHEAYAKFGPFATAQGIDPNEITDTPKVYFTFDDVRSIDAVINQLNEARAMLEIEDNE